ncbi:MAG: AGE family epimerase/isomerase [Candidatus Hodarchaeales archaeon]
MIQVIIASSKMKNHLMFSFISILLLLTLLPIFNSFSALNLSRDEEDNQKELQIFNMNFSEDPIIDLKLEGLAQDDDPEIIFPTFLYTSIEIANLLIENLYDNNSDGFYFSSDEQWQNSSINPEKRSYDNAQAILALIKLADAVINQTEREFALNIAEKTATGMVNNLWDPDFGGFYISPGDRYKKPGIHGKAIQAFLSLYEVTGNSNYRDVAIETLDFIDTAAWNDTQGYYSYVTSHTGLPLLVNPYVDDSYEPQSLRVDHNAIMGNALLDFYEIEANEEYLTQARQIYDIINATCRNTSTNLFYTGVDAKQEIVFPEVTDLFINSLILEFQAHLYNVTEETKYYEEFLITLNSVLLNFWDNTHGGFLATSSAYNSSYVDATKFTERQFYGIRALDEAYKLTDNNIYYNLILDTIEILNTDLYDQVNGGYYQLSYPDGTQSGNPTWKRKVTVTQSLAIYSLANIWLYSKPGALNVLWSPSTPRPQDSVVLLIAAFDSVGISKVDLNYSIDGGSYELKEMVPHSVGNMFKVTLDAPHPDGTTIDFNIIIKNNDNVQTIRGEYSFFWQNDRWPPEVEEIGFLPGKEIPVNEEFTVVVSAHDVPSQGTVKYIRFHYHITGGDETSLPLEKIEGHLWQITFPDGLPKPGTYGYYFESLDFNLIAGFSHVEYFFILGHEAEGLPISLIIGLLVSMGIVLPGGLYTYVEYKKKSARRKLKVKKEVRLKLRGRKLGKRGTKRT